MNEKVKNGCITGIVMFFGIGLLGTVQNCSLNTERNEYDIAMTAYDSIMNYTLTHYKKKGGGVKDGSLYGEYANFEYDLEDQTITVDYEFTQFSSSIETYIENKILGNVDSYREIGSLSSFRISESCGLNNEEKYYPVSLRCRWQPSGTGGGNVIISLSNDKRVNVDIFGENNFQYWMYYDMESLDRIIEILNNARAEIAKLNKTEFVPIESIENIKATILSSFENETYWCDEEQKIADKNHYKYIVKEGKIGLADEYRGIILFPIYSRLELSDNGKYAIVKKDELQGIMKIDSTVVTEILPVEYSYIAPLEWYNLGKGFPIGLYFSENDPYVYTIKNEKAGVYDKNGNCICDNKYEYIFYYDYLFCKTSNGLDIINPTTKKLVHIDCEDNIPSTDSYCLIKRNGKWGVIDKEGNLVIDTIYDEFLEGPEHDLFTLTDGNTEVIAIKDGKYGEIDLNGNNVIPFEYDYAKIVDYTNNTTLLFKGEFDKDEWKFEGIWQIFKNGEIEPNTFSTREEAIEYAFPNEL